MDTPTPSSISPTSSSDISAALSSTALPSTSLDELASSLPNYLIGGGIALAFIIILGCGSFWWKRRRRRNRFGLDEDEDEDERAALREWERSWRKIRQREGGGSSTTSLGGSEGALTPIRGSYDVPSTRSPSPPFPVGVGSPRSPVRFPSPLVLSDRDERRRMMGEHRASTTPGTRIILDHQLGHEAVSEKPGTCDHVNVEGTRLDKQVNDVTVVVPVSHV